MNLYYESDALQHHGIKGMKWGVRRFQRKDGSYTPAGRKRYYSVIESKLRAEKHATDARRETYKRLNNSPKKHSRLQYEVSATVAGYKARKESVKADKEANRQMRAEKKAVRQAKRELKKIEKQQHDEFVKARSKEILAGESFIGKAWDLYTGGHKIQADIEYALRDVED